MPDPTIQIVRKGVPFTVVDTKITAWWRYWHLFENGTWEAPALDAIDRLLPAGGVLLDIGAWVGPITLWAAKRGAQVLAIEPDPEAYRQLMMNISLNDVGDQVRVIHAAAATSVGMTSLWSVDDHWGESTSSMTLKKGAEIQVPTIDIVEVARTIEGLSLVKCDIEGGETTIMPTLGPLLRSLRVPMVLAIHPGRYEEAGVPALQAEIAEWNVTYLDPGANEQMVLMPR